MKLILSQYMGFCFGVKRAVEKTLSLANSGLKLVTYGELIHNHHVISKLNSHHIFSINNITDIPEDTTVFIRSHGVDPKILQCLEDNHIPYIDLTCPFVERIHNKILNEKEKYDLIIIVGAPKHPEVVGIIGCCNEKQYYVISDPHDVDGLPEADAVLVLAQTTTDKNFWEEICSLLRIKYSNIEFFQSICETTANRQKEVHKLASLSDAVLVIGDSQSSNTQKLYSIASQKCKNTFFVENASQVLLDNFLNCDIISIVAGASTPDWIIREVVERMSEMENAQVVGAELVNESLNGTEEENVVEQVVDNNSDSQNDLQDSDFLTELEKTFSTKISRGSFITGSIVQVTDDEIFVNIGYKSDGIIRKEDLYLDSDAPLQELFHVGDEIEAKVVALNDGEGNVRLSRKEIEGQLKWKNFVESINNEEIYQATVEKVVKGGVLAKFNGYNAFIPASQLSIKYLDDFSEFLNKTIDVTVVDVDKRQKRFVLSHRTVLQKIEDEKKKELFNSFEKDSVIKGKVKRITNFGAFVDIGGVDGLLHITDISWSRIESPKEVLHEGDEINVKILNIDPEKGKISLGYKQLQPKPWDLAAEKYIVGESVTGKVVRITPFGAFVSLEPTIDGLIHISQISNHRIEKVEDVLTLGQEVTAQILDVDVSKKRISLSIRALLKEEKAEEEKKDNNEENEEDFSYTIPPVEEATISLADAFQKAEEK